MKKWEWGVCGTWGMMKRDDHKDAKNLRVEARVGRCALILSNLCALCVFAVIYLGIHSIRAILFIRGHLRPAVSIQARNRRTDFP